jgi:hypothetical protein
MGLNLFILAIFGTMHSWLSLIFLPWPKRPFESEIDERNRERWVMGRPTLVDLSFHIPHSSLHIFLYPGDNPYWQPMKPGQMIVYV